MVAAGEIRYHEVESTRQLIKLGAMGRVDCILMENTAFDIIYPALRTELIERGISQVRLKKGPITGWDPVYIGYSRPAREAGKYPALFDFMQAFDAEVYKMQKAGEIERIMLEGGE